MRPKLPIQPHTYMLTPAAADAAVPQADVINRGFGGFNTKTALLALPEIMDMLSKQQIALAVLWLGANDAASPEGSE